MDRTSSAETVGIIVVNITVARAVGSGVESSVGTAEGGLVGFCVVGTAVGLLVGEALDAKKVGDTVGELDVTLGWLVDGLIVGE